MNQSRIIDSLRKERVLFPSAESDRFIERLAEEQEHVNLCTVYSLQARNAVSSYDGQYVIIWDECYWKYCKKYLNAVAYSRKRYLASTQAVTAVMAEYLSERYSGFREISHFLGLIRKQFGNVYVSTEAEKEKLEQKIKLAKFFSLFHEIGHIRIAQQDASALNTRQIIFNMYSGLKREHFASLGQWADVHYRMVREILAGNYTEILEELMADVYAAGKLAVYLKSLFKNVDLGLVCEAAAGIGYILGFQNLFNVITKAWELHYAEMRFGLSACPRGINPYINKLETVRSGLGSIMIISVLTEAFELREWQRDQVWKYYDMEHVDNSAVMECMAGEEFICTAIEEARGNCINL